MKILGSIRGREDLVLERDILYGTDNDMKFLSFVRFLKDALKVSHYKHEWVDDSLLGNTLSLTATGSGNTWDSTSAATSLPVPAGDIVKLKVGDILQLPGGSYAEKVRVTAIDTGANTISATRGFAGTTATAQGTAAFTAIRVGNSQTSGSDPISPAMTTPTERYNYTQQFESPVQVARDLNALKTTSSSEYAYQKVKQLKELLVDLDKTLYFGSRSFSSGLGSMGGLREWLTGTYNANTSSFAKTHLYTGVVQMINAGGVPTQLHAHPTMVGILERLLGSEVSKVQIKDKAQMTVSTFQMMGQEIKILPNRNMISTEFLLLDDSKINYGALKGNGEDMSFANYIVTENGKQLKSHIIGEYTLEVRNPAAAGIRVYGITG